MVAHVPVSVPTAEGSERISVCERIPDLLASSAALIRASISIFLSVTVVLRVVVVTRRARRRWTVGLVPCVCVVMVAQASSRCQSDQTHYILVYTFLSELHQGDAWGLRNRKRGGFRMSCQGTVYTEICVGHRSIYLLRLSSLENS